MNPMALMGLLAVVALIAVVPLAWAQGGAQLQVEPGKGTYGLQVFLKGSGFAPNSQVQIQAFGQTIAPQANSTGEFLVIAFAPTDQGKFKPGPLKITVKDSAGNSAEATFTLEELTTSAAPRGGAGAGSPVAAATPTAATTSTGGSGPLIVIVVAVLALVALVFAVIFFSTRHKGKKVQGPPEAVRPGPTAAAGRTARPAAAARPGVTADMSAPEPTSPQPAESTTENETTLVMQALPKLSTRPTLQIVGGEGDGTVYSLEQKTTVIGRGEDCDIVLNHPLVSRHHAKIVRVGPSYYIHDLQSTNSTMVNGQRIDQHVLQPDDEIQIGVTLLLFQQPQGE
jgi:hypothetical protein